MLAALLEKELRFFRDQERLKAELVQRFDFSMQAMFKEIDDWNYKYIDIKNLKRFLMKTSVYPDDASLKAILRRLDTDGDARLSFREFTMAVQPQLALK
jgi:Ca2+-binding EF-hand superfamily protein